MAQGPQHHREKKKVFVIKYRGADKSFARIDDAYMKIEHISCLSSL